MIIIETNNFKNLQKDLPQLIIALDALDDSANYIHIADAKENITYYCPCCKGVIKPRAYKDSKKYQVQPHFYHETGGCNEETFVHYICKIWLFEKDSKFIVNGFEYTVDTIDTEKTYTTSFGSYRPDITVYTREGSVFFFEIKYSNKKTEHYIPKWDELGNDVVEVDARYFINQKVDHNIPEFALIYSDGNCLIKSYTRKDYEETIAKRKLDWKRQDKLNYKIMWERLDWFWYELQRYKEGTNTQVELLDTFESLDFSDIEICWDIINKMSCCKNIKDIFRNILNGKSKKYFNTFINGIKKNYDGKIQIISTMCEPKKDLCFIFTITDDYNFINNCFSDCIICENKSWIISPSKVIGFVEKFKTKENDIILHCENVVRLKTIYNWNKAPMLYDSYPFGLGYGNYICENDIYANLKNTKYITDIDYLTTIIDRNIINAVSSTFLNTSCMDKAEITIYVTNYINNYLINDQVFEKTNDGENLSFFYKNQKVIDIKINDNQIFICNEHFNYSVSKKESTKLFLNKCIESSIIKFQTLVPLLDMIADIRYFSNNTWDFDVDIENKSIIISLTYIVPYYESYTKQIVITKDVNIADFFEKQFTFSTYRNNAFDLINNRLAPTMNVMLNEEILNYNSMHINSILYKTSEVKQYDK